MVLHASYNQESVLQLILTFWKPDDQRGNIQYNRSTATQRKMSKSAGNVRNRKHNYNTDFPGGKHIYFYTIYIYSFHSYKYFPS